MGDVRTRKYKRGILLMRNLKNYIAVFSMVTATTWSVGSLEMLPNVNNNIGVVKAAEENHIEYVSAASNSAINIGSISIDYGAQYLVINPDGYYTEDYEFRDTQISVAFPVVANGKIKKIGNWTTYNVPIERYKVDYYSEYEGTQYRPGKFLNDSESEYPKAVSIDLSAKASGTKSFYILIKGNVSTTPIAIKFDPVTNGKLQATVSGYDTDIYAASGIMKRKVDTGEVTEQGRVITEIRELGTYECSSDVKSPVVKVKEKNGSKEFTDLEFSVGSSEYRPYVDTDQDNNIYSVAQIMRYQEAGATLKFRVAARGAQYNEDEERYEYISRVADNLALEVDNEKIATYNALGNFASAEVKVKIPKRSAAPKVKVDYQKNTFTVPSGSKYAIYAGGTKILDNKDGGTAVAMNTKFDGYVEQYFSQEGAIVAWKAGDATKADSLLANISFDPIEKLTVTDATPTTIDKAEIVDSAGKKVTATEETQTDKMKKDKKQAITIKNDTEDLYEYVVGTANTVPSVTDKATGKIAKGKSKKITVAEGAIIYIHRAGDAKKKIWATEYVKLGVAPSAEATPTVAPSSEPTAEPTPTLSTGGGTNTTIG